MGREIKRIPMDFDWPIGTEWEGYINPHYRECVKCNGRGETAAMARLSDLVGLIMLSGEDSLKGRNHPYFENMWGLHNMVIPSPDMAELTVGLAGRKMGFIGHDSIDRWSATKKIIKAAGLDETWGLCPHCNGDGIAKEYREAYNNWERTDPPEGDGWQMWEDTTGGSPMSPVFETPEKLARWLADTNASAMGGTTANYEQWLSMIKGSGHAVSVVMTNGRIMSGVEAESVL